MHMYDKYVEKYMNKCKEYAIVCILYIAVPFNFCSSQLRLIFYTNHIINELH